MKKIISAILVLTMVLTMALSVSAGSKTTLSALMEGDYKILDPMAPPAMNVVIYELSFVKTNPSGGTLTIVDNNFSGIGGTYTYSVDANDVATVTVEDGNTGIADAAATFVFSYDMGGNLTFLFGRNFQPYTCISASGSGAENLTGTKLNLGSNSIPVTISNYYATPVDVYFTAEEAGTYIIALATGEESGVIGAELDGGSQDLVLPYEVTLEAGESFKAFVTTDLSVLQNEGVTDNIDIVITKKGAEGSAPTGDNTVVYVAVGVVAIASILGCAIVSKKRVTE